MSTAIIKEHWNYRNVLHEDDMSYGYYFEQLIYPLFIKMPGRRN